ncbi:uncharacterized protein J7T54_004268 [Emericellopsis cladophorae]|uniref:DUF1909-domain-containing protein n=1 Tax=Emericellopsis cladophorae TaxID=2686198 RepID=A0A9P9Y4G8_9HYPO|nr:uncharacterized protein J7T54_004268 [Emericellopsis cladophorae]KAI6783241.1 hypothetical protein J7T54_004268 [Emericellopsis cladophorae]
MGNGAKAQQKRERAAKDKTVAKSQLKVNSQACDIQCVICRSTFLKTSKAPQYAACLTFRDRRAPDADPFRLTEHAENKHGKALTDCFPTFVQA